MLIWGASVKNEKNRYVFEKKIESLLYKSTFISFLGGSKKNYEPICIFLLVPQIFLSSRYIYTFPLEICFAFSTRLTLQAI